MAHAGVGFDALDRDGDAHVSREEYDAAFDKLDATSVLKVCIYMYTLFSRCIDVCTRSICWL